MQEASIQGLLRIVLVILLIIFFIKIVMRIFMPYLLKYILGKTQKNVEDIIRNKTQPPHNKSPKKTPKYNKDNKVGEYIDFEEIE